MPAKQSLTVHQLIAFLEKAPLSPATLAEVAGTSLATANRRLKDALSAGVVKKVGRGPATCYRLVTALDNLADQASVRCSGSSRIVIEMSPATAILIQEALELYARIGRGALDKVVALCRMEGVPLPGSTYSPATLRPELPTEVGNPRIHQTFKTAWEAQVAIRRHLDGERTSAEDITRITENCVGATEIGQFLEVGTKESKPGLLELLQQLPDGYYLGLNDSDYRVIGPSADNTTMLLYAESENPQTVISMAKQASFHSTVDK